MLVQSDSTDQPPNYLTRHRIWIRLARSCRMRKASTRIRLRNRASPPAPPDTSRDGAGQRWRRGRRPTPRWRRSKTRRHSANRARRELKRREMKMRRRRMTSAGSPGDRLDFGKVISLRMDYGFWIILLFAISQFLDG